MNIMFVTADNELLTPSLGSILAGVTRESILALAADHGLTPVERPIEIDEVLDGVASGRIPEVFACGTAAVVAPIGQVKGKGYDLTVNGGEPGPVTARLKKALTDIQFGRAPDPRHWLERVV